MPGLLTSFHFTTIHADCFLFALVLSISFYQLSGTAAGFPNLHKAGFF